MSVWRLGTLSVGILLLPIITFAQTPARDRPATEAPAGTARLRGRVMAADGETPLRRAQVRAVASAIRTTRLSITDAEGRYEFANLPAGRYTISVNKAGYVGLEFGQRRPFEGGRPLDLADAQVVEQIDFALPRGSVITGRITDDAGDPIVGAYVQAMLYRYLPGGRRHLSAAGSQSWLSNMTNDLGEYRLFGLMPGTYVVAAYAQNMGVVSLTQPNPQTGGVASIDARDGYLQTYYPGAASIAEAAPVLVNLSEEANASFALATGRMSRVSGIVRRTDGRPAAGSQVGLRPTDTTASTMGGWGNASIAQDGSFTFANVPPGQFILEVMPSAQMTFAGAGGVVVTQGPPGATSTQEFARVPVTVGGGDIAGLSIVTRPGATVSGRVVFQSETPPKNTDGTPIRIIVASADPTEVWRAAASGPNNGAIDANGRFQLQNVMGPVLFRTGTMPSNLLLKSVVLNGVDITDRPYDASSGDANGLEIVVAEQAHVVGTAANARGEAIRDFKVALFPAGVKPGLLTTRFMHTATADPNGGFQINRLPAGEYLGVAVESFDLGAEWDPAFQQRVLPAARRFALSEGQTLTVVLPYVE